MDVTIHRTITRTITLTLDEQEARHLYRLLELAKHEITFPANGELGPFLDLLQSQLGTTRQLTLAHAKPNGKDEPHA